MFLKIALSVIALISIFAFLLFYICFRIVFYSPAKKRIKPDDEYSLQQGKTFVPYHDIMKKYIDVARSTPCKKVEVTSFDGLTLRGRYFEYKKGAPIEIIFHGYRGDSESDLSGGVIRCFSLKRNAILVDQRSAGKSDGSVITFGINESKDCLPWINYVLENIDKNAKIFLSGISMGASTVLIASAKKLPSNVVGIIADCGFTSAKDIIKKVITDMKLPANILYPFVKIGAKLFGKFDLEETSPIESVKKTNLPILFIHGKVDDYVPYQMSIENYNACNSKIKQMSTFNDAGHGLSYLVNPEKYVEVIEEFTNKIPNL